MFRFFLLFLAFNAAYAMDCTFGKSNSLSDTLFNSCPRLLLDSADEKFCCPDKCCTFQEFVQDWLIVIVPVIIVVLIISFIISCVCCFCCPFCCLYKQRH